MSANLEAKKQIVEEIKARIKDSNTIVFGDFRGINVVEDTKLRKDFTAAGVDYKVYKNRLIVKALNELGITNYDASMFEGTTSMACGKDEVAPAKIFCNAIKDLNKMQVKFGIVNGNVVGKAEVEALAAIPGKETLIAMLLNVLQAPVSGLARALNEISKKEN